MFLSILQRAIETDLALLRVRAELFPVAHLVVGPEWLDTCTRRSMLMPSRSRPIRIMRNLSTQLETMPFLCRTLTMPRTAPSQYQNVSDSNGPLEVAVQVSTWNQKGWFWCTDGYQMLQYKYFGQSYTEMHHSPQPQPTRHWCMCWCLYTLSYTWYVCLAWYSATHSLFYESYFE